MGICFGDIQVTGNPKRNKINLINWTETQRENYL